MADQKTKTKTSRPPILGETYDGTVKGFKAFLVKANAAHLIGYELLTLVKLDRKLAAVWKLRRDAPSDSPYSSFVGEDEEPPIPSYS